jgi:hypothetical protein
MSRGTAMSTMNIGRWRRFFSARFSTVPLPSTGSGLAVDETTMSASADGWELRQRDRVAVELLGDVVRALDGAVGDDDATDAVLVQVAGGQLDGLAGADQQAVCLDRSLKICRARLTAAKATETGLLPMAVSVRTCLATEKVC